MHLSLTLSFLRLSFCCTEFACAIRFWVRLWTSCTTLLREPELLPVAMWVLVDGGHPSPTGLASGKVTSNVFMAAGLLEKLTLSRAYFVESYLVYDESRFVTWPSTDCTEVFLGPWGQGLFGLAKADAGNGIIEMLWLTILTSFLC